MTRPRVADDFSTIRARMQHEVERVTLNEGKATEILGPLWVREEGE